MNPQGDTISGRPRIIDIAVLPVVAATSLVLTTTVNGWTGLALLKLRPGAAWIATAAIPSCIVIAVLFLFLASNSVLRWHRLDRRDRAFVFMLSALWLGVWIAGSVVAAVVAGHWTTYARGGPAILAFLVFGPIGEELLFRGLIFGRIRRLWPTTARPAVWISTILFSLHHIQLHSFPPTGMALAQIAFTLPMGLVLAQLRERSGSLWPGMLVHVATNVPAVF